MDHFVLFAVPLPAAPAQFTPTHAVFVQLGGSLVPLFSPLNPISIIALPLGPPSSWWFHAACGRPQLIRRFLFFFRFFFNYLIISPIPAFCVHCSGGYRCFSLTLFQYGFAERLL